MEQESNQENSAAADAAETTGGGGANNADSADSAAVTGDEAAKEPFEPHPDSDAIIESIVGVMKISRQGYSDHTAFDKKNAHFDPKSDPGNPRWYMVDVTFKEKFNRVLTLAELKTFTDKQLKDFQLLKKGNRLSIMPVSAKTWEFVYRLASQRN